VKALKDYSVSQKIPRGFLTFIPKRLGDVTTRVLYVPIYARLQIFIQLSANCDEVTGG